MWTPCTLVYRWPFTFIWILSSCRMKYRCDSIGIHYLPNDKSQLKTNHQSQQTNNCAKFAVLRHWNWASAKFECVLSCKLPRGPLVMSLLCLDIYYKWEVAYYVMHHWGWKILILKRIYYWYNGIIYQLHIM